MRNGLPSGDQIELRAGSQHVVVVEVGAGLRAYSVAGRDVLDGYGEHEMATAGRGQVLMPWPNRLEDGAYEFEGSWHHLPHSEPQTQTAIHGLVRWVPWSVSERDDDRVVLEYALHPQPGCPFSLTLNVEYALSDDGLRVTSTAANVGSDACPYGTGAHPYLTIGTETVDTVLLRAPGRTMLRTDGRGVPAGVSPFEGTEYDFRKPKAIGATRLDNAYTYLERDGDGVARVELSDPDNGRSVSLCLGESYRAVWGITV